MLRAQRGHRFVIYTESNIGYTWENGEGTPTEAIKRTMSNGIVGDWNQTHRRAGCTESDLSGLPRIEPRVARLLLHVLLGCLTTSH